LRYLYYPPHHNPWNKSLSGTPNPDFIGPVNAGDIDFMTGHWGGKKPGVTGALKQDLQVNLVIAFNPIRASKALGVDLEIVQNDIVGK